jgi:branched-chain amino acid transport system permease protein
MLTMVVVGGIGTVWGPALGAVLLETLPQAVKFLEFPSSVMAPLQGILFTGLVLFFLFARPQGLVGTRRELRRPAPEEEAEETGAGTP